MKARYVQAMDVLHRLCLLVCGLSMAAIAIIIPWGVFTRYVLNSASSWPEPLAVLLMIVLAFLSAAVCYREYLHIGVAIVPNLLEGPAKIAIGWAIELCMAATNLFMLWWGLKLVETTWHQTIGEFPIIGVGMSYLPIPVAGLITLLFVIERLWTGKLFAPPPEDPTTTIAFE
jgi:TRAP-type C4-dicarboxylate transport system permease small subunit